MIVIACALFIGGGPMLKPSGGLCFEGPQLSAIFHRAEKRLSRQGGHSGRSGEHCRADVQLQALVAGELHFANINADNIIAWNERTNGNLKVAAGSSNAAPYWLIGAKI